MFAVSRLAEFSACWLNISGIVLAGSSNVRSAMVAHFYPMALVSAKLLISLMLIARFAVHEKKNVALFVPKSAKGPVWERELRNKVAEDLIELRKKLV